MEKRVNSNDPSARALGQAPARPWWASSLRACFTREHLRLRALRTRPEPYPAGCRDPGRQP